MKRLSRLIISFAAFALCFPLGVSAQTRVTTYQQALTYIQQNVGAINQGVPSYLKPVIGDGIVQVEITTASGVDVFSFRAKDGAITQVTRGKIGGTEPNVTIKLSQATAEEIAKAASPATAASAAVTSGKIKIEYARFTKAVEAFKQAEPKTQLGLAAAVAVIVVVNPTIGLYLPNLKELIVHFFNGVLTLFGLKKRRKPWGTVYDAISKTALPLAIVRLFKDDVLTETQVTDGKGRFAFLPQTGKYKIEVKKPGYTYPSAIVSTSPDADYEHVYRGEALQIEGSEQVIASGIPLDPINAKAQKFNPWHALQRLAHKLTKPLLILGLLTSVALLITHPTPLNKIIVALYLLCALMQRILRVRPWKPWGVVYRATDLQPVPLAAVSMLDTKSNKVLQARLTDYEGRFGFLPPPGEYQILVKKDGYTFPSAKKDLRTRKYRHNYFGGALHIKKTKAIVDINIPGDPA